MRETRQLPNWRDFRSDADRIAALVIVTRDLAKLFQRGALIRTGERQYTRYRVGAARP